MDKALVRVGGIPDALLADLDTRQVALWIRDLPDLPAGHGLLGFLGLPWRLVLSEAYEPTVFGPLESEGDSSTPMTRKRGFVQVIDQDPSRIEWNFMAASAPLHPTVLAATAGLLSRSHGVA